jgi:hypothetical protein
MLRVVVPFWLLFSACENGDRDGDGATGKADCDDHDATRYDGAPDEIDGVDNNCDGVDGVDSDGDGFAAGDIGEDCDDYDNAINPDAVELCGGVDENCNDLLDDDDPWLDPTTTSTWYRDADTDGYGDEAYPTQACAAPTGSVAAAGDCNDLLAEVSPAATESCNGTDDDCDGTVDEGLATTWYADGDGDGYGDVDAPKDACAAPEGYVADATDCDDGDAETHPGGADSRDDGIDQDCDGADATACNYGSAWIDILEEPDAVGDNDGYVIDIEQYQYQYDGVTLTLRTTSWNSFSDDDPALQIDMHVIDVDHTVGFNLSYDNINSEPSPLQLWGSENNYDEALPDAPVSLFHCDDTSDAIVLGVDIADLGYVGPGALEGSVAVGDYSRGYSDEGTPRNTNTRFCLAFEPYLVVRSVSVDDRVGGDGDGLAEPGETVGLEIELRNWCLTATEADLTATVSLDPASVSLATMSDSVGPVGDGSALAPGQAATLSDISLTVAETATPGDEVWVVVTASDAGRSYAAIEASGLLIH